MTNLVFSKEEQELLKQLCQTLDARYFYRLPERKQHALGVVSKQILDSPYFNPVIEWPANIPIVKRVRKSRANLALAFIIYRSLNPEILEPAQGLRSIAYVEIMESKKYNLKILFLSDYHEGAENPPRCYHQVTDFLKREINASNEPIDLFMEQAYGTYKNDFNLPDYVNAEKMRKAFLDCMTPDREKCPFYNLRLHIIDMRSAILDKPLGIITHILNLINQNRSIVENSKRVLLDPKNRFKEIFGSPENIRRYIWEKIVNGRIMKNIEAIEEPEVKAVIFKNMCNWLQVQEIEYKYDRDIPDIDRMDFQPILDYINHGTIPPGKRNLRAWLMEDVLDAYSRYLGLLMDVYLLARLFRPYKKSKKNEFYFSGKPRNAIIFAGGGHNKYYKQVLDDLGFILLYDNFFKEDPRRDEYKKEQPRFLNFHGHSYIGDMIQPLFVTNPDGTTPITDLFIEMEKEHKKQEELRLEKEKIIKNLTPEERFEKEKEDLIRTLKLRQRYGSYIGERLKNDLKKYGIPY